MTDAYVVRTLHPSREHGHAGPSVAGDRVERERCAREAALNLTALDVAPIAIGEDCQIGPNVQLLTPARPTEPKVHREKATAARPITIGDNVWLGGGTIVCPGVTIGENSVIGEGPVVTQDIPANVVAEGNPARVIGEIGG